MFTGPAENLGVEGVVPDIGDENVIYVDLEFIQHVTEKVVSHGPGSGDVFDGQGDGVGLKNADPNGQDVPSLEVLQNDDGHFGDGVCDQTLDPHFNFHDISPLSPLPATRDRI